MKLSVLEILTWLLVTLGLLLRIFEYRDDRGLYLDERSLLKNLVELPVADFHTVLSEQQIAPPGFLVLERVMVRLPLRVVPAARLIPFLCSLASMFLIRSVARRYVAPRAVPIAVGLFALDDWLIYYAAEIKQYSCDVLLTLVALWLAAGDSGTPDAMPTRRRQVLAGFGIVGLWFGYPLAFVLAGVGTFLLAGAVLRKEWKQALGFGAMSLAWGASFAGCYVISHRILSKERFIWDWWNFAFLQLPPRSLTALEGDCWQLLNVFNSPAGVLTPLGIIASAFLALALFAVGVASLGRRWQGGLYLLLAPILFAIVASALRQYPFHGRLLIFLVPSIHLLVGEGAAFLGGWARAPLIFALGAFLLAQPARDAVFNRLIANRAHVPFDTHGDLTHDLLDYLDYLKRPDPLRQLRDERASQSQGTVP
jgi:hypothetical protein